MGRVVLKESDFAAKCNSIEDLFFFQIGANDGISVDPIHKLVRENNWSGILVEPGIDAFNALKQNYSSQSNLIFENSAVTNVDGDIVLWCGTTTPHFTLDYQKAVNMFDVQPNPTTVNGVKSATLLKKHNALKVDLLQIDAEGHDFVILKDWPFDSYRPKIIRFEFINLNDSFHECIEFIKNINYQIFYSEDGADIIALCNNYEF
jgi:FkbM family methyltransferase